jgi:hypothetical protein
MNCARQGAAGFDTVTVDHFATSHPLGRIAAWYGFRVRAKKHEPSARGQQPNNGCLLRKAGTNEPSVLPSVLVASNPYQESIKSSCGAFAPGMRSPKTKPVPLRYRKQQKPMYQHANAGMDEKENVECHA